MKYPITQLSKSRQLTMICHHNSAARHGLPGLTGTISMIVNFTGGS